jgi:alkylation response protein AidB-like acyl-CoA dehydrogenase
MALDLNFTPEQQHFRAEVRAWMQAHAPATPLKTLESAAGFAQHREWERTLASGNWGMITWPKEYGGRGASLIDWLIFEEGITARERTPAREPERHLPARAHADGIRHRGPEGAFPAADGRRGGDLGPGLVGAPVGV